MKVKREILFKKSVTGLILSIIWLFQKYLSPEKGRNSSKKLGIVEDQSTPGGRIRLKLAHVNIDCHEESTGYTPLIIAVLNGMLKPYHSQILKGG
jgi:hypothetical protein